MIKTAIKRPILIIVIFLVVLLLGFISLTNLSIEMFPDIELPTISIMTFYFGASSSDIEEQITKKIESAAAMVPDVTEISSQSKESISIVEVTFDWGKDLEEGLNDLRSQIDFAKRGLPDGAQDPIMFKFSSSMAPAVVLGVSSPSMSLHDLSAFTERYILDKFRQVGGVGSVIAAAQEKKVNIDLDISKLIQYNIPVSQITASIQATNMNVPLGNIKDGKMSYAVRIPGEYETIDEVKKTIIGNVKGNIIYLEDVAKVTFGPGHLDNISKIRSENGMIIIIQKQAGANTIEVVDGISSKLDEIMQVYPKGTKMDVLYDTSQSIKASVDNLKTTVLYALFFVLLIVLLFLRNFRGSLVIGLAIPVSLIVAFIYLYFSGNTINIISPASISIAIGMVVDNSIVVLENIFRHRDEEKENLKVAAEKGTKEVVTAIMASTLTTIAIFIPLLFVEGFIAVFFQQLAFTISIVLIGSLIVSTTLTPMLSSLLLRKKGFKKNKFENVTEKWFNSLESSYSRFLAFALKNKVFIITSMIIVFVMSMMLLPAIKTEFMPSEESEIVFGSIKLNPGLRIEETAKLIDILNERIPNELPEFKVWSLQSGLSTGHGAMSSERNQYTITLIGSLVKRNERERTEKEVLGHMRKILAEYPHVKSFDFQRGGPAAFMGGGKQISLEIFGEDIDTIYKFAEDITNEMKNIPGLIDITLSRDDALSNVSIIPIQEKLGMTGMNTYFLMNSLRAGIYGEVVSVYRKDDFEYDIFVSFDREYLTSVSDLYGLPVFNAMGMVMPLSNVAKIKMTEEPPLIERKDQERIIKVEANVQDIAMSDGVKAVIGIINSMRIPEGVRVSQGGEVAEQKSAFKDLLIAIIFGIVLVFLVMAGQFESFIDPFVIIFSLPFAFVGVVWALFLTGTSLSVMGFIGMLMLVGIVVNNAIVLIDYINKLRQRGIPLEKAVPLAGKTRLRPVLMTALTTTCGLLPLALNTGEGSAMWRPLGTVVVGGLLVSTVVTLVLIPVIYSIFEKRIKRTIEVSE